MLDLITLITFLICLNILRVVFFIFKTNAAINTYKRRKIYYFLTSNIISKLFLYKTDIIDKNLSIAIQLLNPSDQQFIDNFLSITIPSRYQAVRSIEGYA